MIYLQFGAVFNIRIDFNSLKIEDFESWSIIYLSVFKNKSEKKLELHFVSYEHLQKLDLNDNVF